MRRLLKMLFVSLATAFLVAAPAQLVAAQELPADRMLLATEAGLPEDFAGVAPGEANATENAFRPDDYEANFLWGAAVGLTALTVLGVGGLGMLYWAMVVRPKQGVSA